MKKDIMGREQGRVSGKGSGRAKYPIQSIAVEDTVCSPEMKCNLVT